LPWPVSKSFPLFQHPHIPFQSNTHSASCTLSLEIPTQSLFLYGTLLSMYVWSSSSSVVRFAPILEFFTWNNVMPQDLKNFSTAPVHKCSLVPCDALSRLSCWHPYRRTDFSLILKILKFVAIDITLAFHIWRRWIKVKFNFWIYIFIYAMPHPCWSPPCPSIFLLDIILIIYCMSTL
jgi:hypothetical protein